MIQLSKAAFMRRFKTLLLLPLAGLLGGCNLVVLSPAGDVAMQQRDLLVVSTLLMLLIIVPVMALTALFAWRYRHTNTAVPYEPDWDHSTKLELIIWAAPLMIIICLGALTWLGTHLLDPYRRIDRLAPGSVITRLDGVGHVPMFEAPAEITEVISDFIDSHTGQARATG